MPKAIKKRTKKKDVVTETEVKDRLVEIKDKLREKQRTVVAYSIFAGIIIIVIAGLFYYRYSSGQKSRMTENEAYSYFYGEHLKQPMTTPERMQKALDLFKQAYDYRKSGRLLLYIADSYYEMGKYDEALSSVDRAIKNYSSDKDLLPLAYKMMANIQLKKGNKDEALKTLDRLYTSPGTIYKDYALMESGRILESEGKQSEADAKYKELTDKFKDSPFYAEAKAKLEVKKEG
jgi:predicted negative regulator of RcsB-dependent stress response